MADQPRHDHRLVVFDVMGGHPDAYFVLTEALGEWANRQRSEAGQDGNSASQHQSRWAACADAMLEQVEAALDRRGDCLGWVVVEHTPESGWPDLGIAPVVHGDAAAAIADRDERRDRQTGYGRPDRYVVAALMELGEVPSGD